ncbi:hypothetical protein BDV10DRAFT_36522 [Aspergillus recurvatus]
MRTASIMFHLQSAEPLFTQCSYSGAHLSRSDLCRLPWLSSYKDGITLLGLNASWASDGWNSLKIMHIDELRATSAPVIRATAVIDGETSPEAITSDSLAKDGDVLLREAVVPAALYGGQPVGCLNSRCPGAVQ